jgi:precorrin-6A/cobalt-precorrin-6A reductase
MIIVLAGTSESREICSLLQKAGRAVLASVTTSWGKELLEQQGFTDIVQDQLTDDKLVDLIKAVNAEMVIDATHPFATAISQAAMEATQACGIEYVRLERPRLCLPDDPRVIPVPAFEKLEEYITPGQRVFSTLGSKHLQALVPMVNRKEAHLTARVLPVSGVIKNCEELGLRPGQIIAMQGPFTINLNLELFKQTGAELVISKESGSPGGLEAKIEAARQMNIPILIWMRPQLDYPRCFKSSRDVMAYLNDKERD